MKIKFPSRESLIYYLIRVFTFPIRFMPYWAIRSLGKCIGFFGFYLMREYRKRALSNLSLASALNYSPKMIRSIAKKSFQNLAINCLEYPKLAKEKNLASVIQCENPEVATEIYNQGRGIIFFCGHQSNWEVLFLDGTMRMKGIAIGKAIKNKRLYRWIVSIREKNGGKIVSPHNAVREGLRALRKGSFIGIVGDQGMPDSGYSFPFLGRRAWTSTAPALLAYKTKCPIIFAETRRVPHGYKIHYADPIWPDLTQPMEKAVISMMDQALTLMQESIKKYPDQWLWQHNRWKQQTLKTLYKRFRQDCICIILPENQALFQEIYTHLPTLKEIYSTDFLSLLVPQTMKGVPLIDADEVIYYNRKEEVLLHDLRFKLVFNFSEIQGVKAHYERLSVFEVLTLKELKELAKPHLSLENESNLSDIFKRSLCRPGSIW